jgi:hypothetical protein
VRIAFAPTSRAASGLQSKGYYDVKAVLDSVARARDVEIVWIEGQAYERNLAMKQQSHILIDDVVTGNWHRTSLEGLCFGCVVLNKANRVPFFYATLGTLEERLLYLIDNLGTIRDLGELGRLWVLQNWHPIDMVKEYVQAYREVLG